MIHQLVSADLITLYEVGGDRYGSIREFLMLQPAGRSGRRVQRFPRNPQEPTQEPQNAVPEESGASKAIHSASGPVPRSIPRSIPSHTPTLGHNGLAGPGNGLAGSALRESREHSGVRDWLEKRGIREPARSAIALAGCSLELCGEVWRSVNADPKAVSKGGVLVSRLCERIGIEVPRRSPR